MCRVVADLIQGSSHKAALFSSRNRPLKADQPSLKLDALAGDVRELAKADMERDRRLDEHGRELDVFMARMRMLLASLCLLATVLIAVFGFLFANTN